MTLNSNEVTMTLKQVVDLLNEDRKRGDQGYIKHANAMKKVEQLALEQGFGIVQKQDIAISTSNGGSKTIQTYVLNKKQCLAVSAALNSRALMAVINRLEELERRVSLLNVPKDFAQALRLAAEQQELIQAQQARLALNAPKVEFASSNSMSIGEWAKLLTRANEVKVGPNKLMALLRELNYLMVGRDKTERNKPYQKYIEVGYFEIKYRQTNIGLLPQPLITSEGQLALADMVVNYFKR